MASYQELHRAELIARQNRLRKIYQAAKQAGAPQTVLDALKADFKAACDAEIYAGG